MATLKKIQKPQYVLEISEEERMALTRCLSKVSLRLAEELGMTKNQAHMVYPLYELINNKGE